MMTIEHPMATLPSDKPLTAVERAESAPGVTDAVGDWLLTFAVESGRRPSRLPAAPWCSERRGENWELQHTYPADGWRGMPLARIATPRWSAWLAGELYGTPDAHESVGAVLDGRAPATALNGHFLLLAHEKASGEWHVWTNRHATLHAYLATDGARTALGTYMPAVAAATGRTAPDWEGLTSFFGFGFFAADRTHLAGVRILRPATHYRFDGRGRLLSEERYWLWQHAPDRARSYDETVDEFAALFSTVMADLLAGGRVALPISGGLDSRSTVAAVVAGSPMVERLWAYSYGYGDDSVETRIAGAVAGARGLPFDRFTVGPYLFARLPRILAAVEGFQDVTQARQAAVTGEIADHADYLIAAHWGDVLLDDMGVDTHIPEGGLPDLAMKKFQKTGGRWLIDHLGRPQLAAEPHDLLRGMMSAELQRAGAAGDPDFHIKMLKTEQWSTRWTTASLRMFQAAAFPRLPFYDARLVDFFCTVPTAFVRGRRLQLDYLRRYAPDLARVPWQVTGRDLFHDRGDRLTDVAMRAVRKAGRAVTRRPVIERNWEVQFAGAAGREGLTQWLLRPGLSLHEFVSPQAVAELLEAFARDPYTDKRGYTVSMLLTFSAWLELLGPGGGGA
ncbi:MAG: hypothetical protein KA586_06555 [Candidatus Promineofilum sp.]|nr:hypothetical protein [Promineifilum sp.]